MVIVSEPKWPTWILDARGPAQPGPHEVVRCAARRRRSAGVGKIQEFFIYIGEMTKNVHVRFGYCGFNSRCAHYLDIMSKNKQNINSKKFRLRGLKFFLTYPRLPERDDLQSSALAQYEDIFKMTSSDFQYVMAVEKHEDGCPHLHVYLEFNTPQGIYSAGKLDLVFDGVTYHGNYQVVKSEHATLRYIVKSLDDPSAVFGNKDLPIHDGLYYTNIHDHLHSILVRDGFYAAVNTLYSVYPKQAVQNGSYLINNLQLMDGYYTTRAAAERAPKFTLDKFKNVPHEVKAWLDSNKPMSVVLWGPSGVGKTELAKAVLYAKQKRVLFVREIQALKDFEDGFHDAIIFDDLNVSDTPREELIHLVDIDNASDLRLLYRGKRLPADIDRVFTTNTLSYFTRDEAVRRRLYIIHVSESIVLLSSTPSAARADNTSPGEGNVRVDITKTSEGDNMPLGVGNTRVGGAETVESGNLRSDAFDSDLFAKPESSRPRGMYVRVNPDKLPSAVQVVPIKNDSSLPLCLPALIDTAPSSVSSDSSPHSSFLPAEITSPVIIDPAENQPGAVVAPVDSITSVLPPTPKKRGRPKGSKNKKK
jgi:hypothetical protein